MRKKLKYTLGLILIFSIVLSISLASFAGAVTRTYSGSFSDDWTKSVETNINGSTDVLTYGFNTFLINEDFAYSLYYGDYHRSKVSNGNGSHYGQQKQAGEWSDIEVRHSGSSITYSSIW